MIDYKELLQYINPQALTYQEWVNVGMALKYEGCSCDVWDNWSRNDNRYHSGECERKWESFNGSLLPVTGGTIVQLAKESGYNPSSGYNREFDWNDEINDIVDYNYIEGKELVPSAESPSKQLVRYLETLFEQGDNVGYVMQSWQDEDGKYKPANKGNYDRTAGELIELLSRCNDDIGSVLGDYNSEAGAWIRFNPLDGKGAKNLNVTEFRYALVESDSADLEKQNAIIRELELPVAVLMYSGGKSIHAIVRIEAANYDEYRKRVDYLYNVCKKNGLDIDLQNRNPSRLSRMPGVNRGDKQQYIIDTNIGKSNFTEWKEWIEAANDDLPDTECMADAWDNLPELAPPLIHNVLRQGHKMLIAGPSKAGKSYALIELCCAIAEGKSWLGNDCAKGRVMYVNLELDRASCLHRFKDVYTSLNWKPENLGNIDIWNLRGTSIPMDKLSPKLIRRALKKNYIAVVIDPIYKVITGDENSADQMAHFCNQFDKVCNELGCAVIYCHHHSKGAQGGKRSMDRASGSGVFARDPDALLDVIELEISDNLRKEEQNKAACDAIKRFLKEEGLSDKLSQDEELSKSAALNACRHFLDGEDYKYLCTLVNEAEKRTESLTAWRIEGTLREFPKFPPINVWFDYPIHRLDAVGVLKDVESETEKTPWQKATEARKKQNEKNNDSKRIKFENAVNLCNAGEPPTTNQLAEYLGLEIRTVRNWIYRYDYWIDKNTNLVLKKSEENTEK